MKSKIKKFWGGIGTFLRRNARFFGLPLVYLAIVLLCIFYLLGLTRHNLLIFPMLLIPIGIYGYIRHAKQNSKY